MDEPELWRWIWLGTAVVFGLGEMATPGSFFLAPFGVGAAIAAAASFLGAPVGAGWVLFVIVSGGMFLALRPLARRLEEQTGNPQGVGATRLVGERGVVLEAVPAGPDEVGLVRIGREQWRAQTADSTAVPVGAEVAVVQVTGTRVVVSPITNPSPTGPPERSA